jgi:hypothetical protein
LAPISGHFGKVKALRKVDEVENILLETRATKPNRRPQESRSNPRVAANSVRDFLNVSARRFADGR